MTNDERANLYLSSLRRWTAKLQWFGQANESNVEEAERQAFPLEWDNALDRLVDLEAMARHGGLNSVTVAELRAVADELDRQIPTMRRCGVRLPDLATLARARSLTAA